MGFVVDEKIFDCKMRDAAASESALLCALGFAPEENGVHRALRTLEECDWLAASERGLLECALAIWFGSNSNDVDFDIVRTLKNLNYQNRKFVYRALFKRFPCA